MSSEPLPPMLLEARPAAPRSPSGAFLGLLCWPPLRRRASLAGAGGFGRKRPAPAEWLRCSRNSPIIPLYSVSPFSQARDEHRSSVRHTRWRRQVGFPSPRWLRCGPATPGIGLASSGMGHTSEAFAGCRNWDGKLRDQGDSIGVVVQLLRCPSLLYPCPGGGRQMATYI